MLTNIKYKVFIERLTVYFRRLILNYFLRHTEKQQKWHIALGDEGKVIAVLTDSILEIRTKRSDYATIAARTTGALSRYKLE